MAKLNAATQARIFDSCTITRPSEVNDAVNLIVKGRARYETIGAKLNIPWYLIGLFHYRESTCNFKKHLHNGDSLQRRTVNVPAGRPATGTPPFTFEESAEDALKIKKLPGIGDITIGAMLVILEQFNGLGYAYKGLPSPYIWAGTNIYIKGKYIRDRVFDANFVDQQLGTGAILLRMHERGIVTLRGEAVSVVLKGKAGDARAFAIRGVSYVAVRDVAEALGGKITSVENGIAVVSTLGKAVRDFNLTILDGCGYVKARELADYLGVAIGYDGETRTLSLGKEGVK